MLNTDCSCVCQPLELELKLEQLLELELIVCHSGSNTGTTQLCCVIDYHVFIEQQVPSSQQIVHQIFISVSATSLANENPRPKHLLWLEHSSSAFLHNLL